MKILNIILILSLLLLPVFAMAERTHKKETVIIKADQGLHLGHYKNKKKVVIVKQQTKPASSIQIKINL